MTLLLQSLYTDELGSMNTWGRQHRVQDDSQFLQVKLKKDALVWPPECCLSSLFYSKLRKCGFYSVVIVCQQTLILMSVACCCFCCCCSCCCNLGCMFLLIDIA